MSASKENTVSFSLINMIGRGFYILGIFTCLMTLYWAFLETQPALGDIPYSPHLFVIYGLICLMYFSARKNMAKLQTEIVSVMNRWLPQSPCGRRKIKKSCIVGTILLSRVCYSLSGVLIFCSYIQRDYYVIESPGVLLIIPIVFSMIAIRLVRSYRMKNSLPWGMFYSAFAWLLVTGYIQAYLDYIYPDSLFCLA